MQFVVIARDYTDEQAIERRLACREEHFKRIGMLTEQGHFLLGGAMLDDDGKMIGSVLVCDFPSKEALQSQWLSQEPYLEGRVWEHVDIQPFKTALLGRPMLDSILAAI